MMKSFALVVTAISMSCMAASAQSQVVGARTYKAKCQMCHAADGSGSTPAGKAMKALPLNSPDLIKASDASLLAAITNGKGKMPAYSGKLTALQIQHQVAYIRTLQK